MSDPTNPSSDAFGSLQMPVVPAAPRARFASQLRRRLQQELGLPPSGGSMSMTATPSAYIGAHEATVTPYLSCHDAAAAIAFYVEVFDAEIVGEPILNPDGSIGHSELRIGDSKIMLAGEHEPEDVRSPVSLGGTSVQLAVFVPDVDVAIERALARGATLWREAKDGQYGARAGKVRDPFGHNWFIETATEGERRAPRQDTGVTGMGTSRGELAYVTLRASDPERAKAFFAEVLGWDFSGPGSEGGFHVLNTNFPVGLTVRGDEGTQLTLAVDDLEAAVSRVRALGGTATDPAGDASWRTSDCTDGDGLAFRLWDAPPGYRYGN